MIDPIEAQVREEAYYQNTVYRFCCLLEEAYNDITEDSQNELDTLMQACHMNLPQEVFEEVFGSHGFVPMSRENQIPVSKELEAEIDNALGIGKRQTC